MDHFAKIVNGFKLKLLTIFASNKIWSNLGYFPNPNVNPKIFLKNCYIATKKIIPKKFLKFWKGTQFDLPSKIVSYLVLFPTPILKQKKFTLKSFFKFSKKKKIVLGR